MELNICFSYVSVRFLFWLFNEYNNNNIVRPFECVFILDENCSNFNRDEKYVIDSITRVWCVNTYDDSNDSKGIPKIPISSDYLLVFEFIHVICKDV